MTDITALKISELSPSSNPSENAFLPLSEANGSDSEKVSIGTLRETLGFENAYGTIGDALNVTTEGNVFFVYEDSTRDYVLGYVNQGGGTYSALMSDTTTQVRYATNTHIVNSLFMLQGVESFDALRTLKPWYEGQRVTLKSYYKDGKAGGGAFVSRLTEREDDNGIIAAGDNYHWERVIIDGTISPEMFGAVADARIEGTQITGTDNKTFFDSFFNVLISGPYKGTFSAGAFYGIGSNVNIVSQGKDIIVDGNNASFVQLKDTTVLTLQNIVDIQPIAVNDFSVVSYDLGDGGVNSIVNKIGATNHGLSKGDIFKIFSNDLCNDREKDTQMIGEYGVVGAVIDKDNFVSTGVTLENYSTGIKIVKPNPAKVKISDLNFRSLLQDGFNASLFTVRGFISPTINNVAVFNANGVFLSLTSCYRARVNGIKGRVLKNDPTTTSYGYLVNDSSSYYSEISGIDCIEARHAYTTTSANAVLDDDRWDLRGRTIGSVIKDGWAQGCHCAFDTHSPAYGLQFINCLVEDNFRGVNVGGAGIQIRGNNCRVINCTVRNSKYGIALSSASKTSDSNLFIDNFTYSGSNGNIPVNLSGSTNQKITVQLSGDIVTNNGQSIVLSNCELEIVRLRSNIQSTNNGASLFSIGQNGTIRGGNVQVTFSGSSNTHSLVTHTDTNSRVFLNNVRVNGVSNGLSYLDSSSSQYDISAYFTAVVLDTALPGIPFLGYPTTSPNIGAEIAVGQSLLRPLAYRAVSYGATQTVDFNFQFPLNDQIVVRLTVTADSVVIRSVTRGTKQGQIASFNNSANSTSSITFNNNSSNLLSLGENVTLQPNQTLQLYWDGASWRKLN